MCFPTSAFVEAEGKNLARARFAMRCLNTSNVSSMVSRGEPGDRMFEFSLLLTTAAQSVTCMHFMQSDVLLTPAFRSGAVSKTPQCDYLATKKKTEKQKKTKTTKQSRNRSIIWKPGWINKNREAKLLELLIYCRLGVKCRTQSAA